MPPGWFTPSFARTSSSLSLLLCSHAIPPDLYQILVQVGAHMLLQTGCKLISNTSSRDRSLPAGPTGKDKCRSRLGSQILQIAIWKQRCSSAARASALTPRVLQRGPSWQCLKESGGHECIQHALQMPLRSCPSGDLGRGMPGSPAPSCSAPSEMGPFWERAEM